MAPELVNELTGESATPAEFIAGLRPLERAVTRLDDVIANLKAELKAAKQGRDRAVGELRSAVREVKSRAQAEKKGKPTTRGGATK